MTAIDIFCGLCLVALGIYCVCFARMARRKMADIFKDQTKADQ